MAVEWGDPRFECQFTRRYPMSHLSTKALSCRGLPLIFLADPLRLSQSSVVFMAVAKTAAHWQYAPAEGRCSVGRQVICTTPLCVGEAWPEGCSPLVHGG